MDERLKRQLDFALEIDKEKNILRQTHLSEHGRRENDAEHAWHMAIMAYLFREHSNESVDIAKVVLKKHGDYKQYYTEKGKKGQADKQHEYLFKNPMDESRFFAKRIEQRIGATKIPVRSVIIFPEHAEITWDGTPENEIPVIHRKQLIQTLKEENEKNERVLSDDQIDELYHLLADESIELEKNS